MTKSIVDNYSSLLNGGLNIALSTIISIQLMHIRSVILIETIFTGTSRQTFQTICRRLFHFSESTLSLNYWKSIFILIILLLAVMRGKSQPKTMYDSCTLLADKLFDIYIPGSNETIQKNGLKVRSIDMSSLVNGFELITSDSLAKIEKFQLTFNSLEGTLYQKPSSGNRMLDDIPQLIPLRKIKDATLITVDQIIVIYNGAYYRAKGQVYLRK